MLYKPLLGLLIVFGMGVFRKRDAGRYSYLSAPNMSELFCFQNLCVSDGDLYQCSLVVLEARNYGLLLSKMILTHFQTDVCFRQT